MRSVTVRVPVTPETPPLGSDEAVRAVVAAEIGVEAGDLAEVRLQRRSLDARKRRAPCWVLICTVTLQGEPALTGPDLRAVRPKRLTKSTQNF
ncbi:MAG TPA: hypothetical protein DCQ06_04785, partial [Myxococcales bacterium]|nr:hypothetical protein [Myxococcales bacterium]